MATITVRNLDPEVQRLLKVRAAASGRSMEAEVREILTSSVKADTFVTEWLRVTSEFDVDLDLPARSLPREIDLS